MKKILVLCMAFATLCVGAQAQKIVHLNRYAAANAELPAPDGKVRDGLTTDTVHPNAAGYELMEKLLLESLR